MNSGTSKGPKISRWKLAAELFFVAWVVAINLLYYAQFKDRVITLLGRILHR